MSSMARCQYIKSDHTQCRANAMKGSSYCYAHREHDNPKPLTREGLFRLVEDNGGSQGLDLSGERLLFIDLGSDTIMRELQKVIIAGTKQAEPPKWVRVMETDLVSEDVLKELRQCNGFAFWPGINLEGAILNRAFLAGADLTKADLSGASLQSVEIGDGT